jgi:glycosyltransferase involved in cell wall biosynthesis
VPISVHQAKLPSREAQRIACRTIVLQDGPPLARTLKALQSIHALGARVLPALKLLIGDMQKVGWFDRRSWALAGQWFSAARMAVHLLETGCRHIHAHFVGAPTQIAMYASAMTDIPFTCTAHAQDIFLHALLLPEKAQRSRMLLTVSHFNKTYLEERGVDARKVDVVRCAPGIEALRAASVRRGPTYRIGTLCRLVEKKGVDDVLRAVSLLVREGRRPVKLQIAGEGPERLRLQVLVDKLDIEAQVEFLGTIPHHGVAQWMRTLDLFVTACKTDRHGDADGIPVVLMEAMSVGLPVVSTRISGVPELVLDGQTGYLAEPGNVGSLVATLRRAMNEPERARAIGRAARAHVRWEFGREVNLRRLLRHIGDARAALTRPAPLEEAA